MTTCKIWPKKIRSLSSDAVCIAVPHTNALAAAYLSGVPLVICPRVENGWSPFETRTYKLLCLLAVTRPHHMGSYAPREYLRLLEPMGIHTSDTTKSLRHSEEAEQKIHQFLQHQVVGLRFVVISPAAGNKIKQWPPERFAQVAQHIVTKYALPVVVIGASADKEEVAAMMRLITNTKDILNTYNIFSLDELKALISKASLFVAVDTVRFILPKPIEWLRLILRVHLMSASNRPSVLVI